MGGGGGSSQNTTETPLSGLSIQNSANGLPIQLVYGTQRVKPNLLGYTDFTPISHTTTQSSGGKGGSGGDSTNTTYTYTAAFLLALGEGPVAGITNAWIDKTQETPSSLFSLFLGTYPQAPWSYLTSTHPGQDLGYQGIAYAAASGYDLGNSSSLPNHSFEVAGKCILAGTQDADPADIVTDLFTSSAYGVPNAPALSGLTQFSNYCRSAGLLLSPCYDTQTGADQMLTDLMQVTNTGVYFSEGVLKFVPYGDAAASGHGATYTPNLTPVANFGDDDFLDDGSSDPVTIKRNAIAATVSTTADAFNQVTLEFLDRASDYNASTVIVQDQVSIDVYGLRPMGTITAHQIADAAVAQAVATLILQRAVYVRAQYEFRLGWQWCGLEPTDLVTLTDTALGLNLYPVRLLQIEEDEFGTLTVLAEDAPPGVSSHVVAPVPPSGGYNLDQAIPPGSTNTPVIFEAPNSLTAPDLQVWIAASGGANWGGCNVWVSDDGSTYRQIGSITNPARHGTLTSLLAAGSDPDTAHTLAVELLASRGQLLAGTHAAADAGNTMLWVDGELIAYADATLTGGYAYSLGYLRRGQAGTTIATHASGAQFARLDEAIFSYTVPASRIGSPIWIKLPAYNTWGQALQSLSDVPAYNHTLAGNKPAPLTGLTATGGMFEVMLSWAFTANQIDRDYIEVWGATTNNRASAALLSSVKNPAQSWAHPGLQPAQTWYYWARVVDNSGNTSDFYPTSATGGVAAAPSADPSALLTQLSNSLGMGQLASSLATPIGTITSTLQPAVATLTPLLPIVPAITTVAAQAPAAINANAIAALQSALSDYDLTRRMQWQEAVTNATISTDPVTGKISLLATANVTTDVQAQLNQVQITANAAKAEADVSAGQITTINGNLTTAQGQITTLAGQLSSSASTVYVDASVANATGQLTTQAANNASALAQTAIQTALDDFTQSGSLTNLTANVATMQAQIATAATALQSEVTSRSALVATVAANNAASGAAILAEQTTRATADTALSNSITTLQATVTLGDNANAAAITAEQTARTSGDSALSASIASLTATVTGNAASASSALTTEATTRASADSALSNTITALASTVTTGDSTNAAAISAEATTRATADTSLSNSITALQATVTANATTASAATSAEATTRATADTALSSRATALESSVNDATNGLAAKANITYVDTATANLTGSIANTANALTANFANSSAQNATAEIQSALDAFAQGGNLTAITGALATVQSQVQTSAAALQAEVTSRSALVALVASNGAALITEQTVRAGADSALTDSITALTATVTGNATSGAAALSSEATARAGADSALSSTITALAATVSSGDSTNVAALSTEATTRASADSALSTSISALTATVAGHTSAITAEQTARANADTALTTSISTVSASAASANSAASAAQGTANTALANAATAQTAANTNASAITAEATARAAGDSANASSITTLSARLDTGDYAAVKTSATASASAITGLQANYVLQVDTNGHVAGMELASGAGGASIVFLADKFLICKPDGTGTPKQVLMLGTVNGVSTLGLDGSAVIDGSIVARSISVSSLSALTANLGTVTAGRAQNAANTNYVDFNAAGSTPFIKVGSNVTINADGSGVFSRTVLSAPNVIYTHDFSGLSLAPNQWARIYIESVSASSAAISATGYPVTFAGLTSDLNLGGRFIMDFRVVEAAGYGPHAANYPSDSDGALFLDANGSGYNRTVNGGIYVDVRFIPVAGTAANVTITNFHIDVLRT